MVSIPGIDQLGGSFSGIGSQIMYWVGIIFWSLLFFAVVIAGYLFMQYKYKVTIMERRGAGKGYDAKTAEHSVGKIIKDRAKQVKDKQGIIKWKLLKSKKSIEPPNFETIYPGNNIFLYKVGPESFVPVNFTCSNPSASFSPLPQHIRYWEQLEIRQAAEDYQNKSAWDRYGNVIVMMGTIMFCLILVGVTVYYTYQHANGVSASLSGLTNSLKNINTIGGIS